MTKFIYTNPEGSAFVQASGNASLSEELAKTETDPSYFYGLQKILRNPDPILRQSGEAADIYEELLHDPQVGAAVENRQAGTLLQEYFIDREKVDAADAISVTAADSIEEIFDVVLGEEVVDDTTEKFADTPLFGYQVLEVIWEVRQISTGSWWVPVRLEDVPHSRILFDPSGQMLLRTKEAPDGIPVPERKFILLRNRARKRNPYGMAALARCFWPVTFKKAVRFWVKFIEKYGMPWALIKYRSGADRGDVDKWISVIEAAIQDAVIAVPDTSQAEIVEPSPASSQLYKEFLAWCDEQISKGITGHTGTTDATPGKLGSEEAAIGVLDARVQRDSRMVRRGWNLLLRWMYELNWDTAARVKYALYKAADVNLETANRDKTVADMGYEFSDDYMERTYSYKKGDIRKKPAALTAATDVPDAPDAATTAAQPASGGTGSELRSSVGGADQISQLQSEYYLGTRPREAALAVAEILYGFSPQDAARLFPELPPDPPGGPAIPQANTATAAFAQGDGSTPPDQQAIDERADAWSGADQQSQMEALIAPILAIVNAGGDPADMKKKIEALYPSMDTSEIESILASAFLYAEATGGASANGTV